MIQQITLKNILSFRDETVLSFEPIKDDKLAEYHLEEVRPGVKLLKLGIMYGANASGKSNFIKAYAIFLSILLRRGIAKTDPTGIIPFKLDEESQENESVFGITFYADSGIKYVYTLRGKSSEVTYERLTCYRTQQPALLYERTNLKGEATIKFGHSLSLPSKIKSDIELRCLPNMTVLGAYLEVNHNSILLEDVTKYFANKLDTPITPKVSMLGTIKEMSATETDEMTRFLRQADFNISDIERIGNDKKIVYFTHKVTTPQGETHKYRFQADMESDGTLRTIGLALRLSRTIKKKSFLPVDEIESSLHPLMAEYIVENFLRESKGAQLLLTTHHSGFLHDKDAFRDDNFWFASKDEAGASSVYALTDFQGFENLNDRQHTYLAGLIGAIPEL